MSKTYTKYNLTEDQLEAIVEIGVSNFDDNISDMTDLIDEGSMSVWEAYSHGESVGCNEMSFMIIDIAKEGGKL